MSEAVIEVAGLRKQFEPRRRGWRPSRALRPALADVSLRLGEGRVLGLLGRNGAGKTTLLRLLMGLELPTCGSSRVYGEDSRDLSVATKRRIGYLPQGELPFSWLRVGEALRLAATLYPDWDFGRQDELLVRLELSPRQAIQALSQGQQRRFGLLCVLCSRPQLLLLDEPAADLDPVARRELLDLLIEQVGESGTTLVLSSHLISDVERIATDIAILDRGRLVCHSPIEDLQASVRALHLEVPEPIERVACEGLLSSRTTDQRHWRVVVAGFEDATVDRLRAAHPAARVTVRGLALEEILLAYVEAPCSVD